MLVHLTMASAVASAAFLVVAASLFLLLRRARASHADRLVELDAARDLLRHHFEAAQRIVNDPASAGPVRDFVHFFSESVGRRDVARGVARSIMKNTPRRPLSTQSESFLREFSKALHDLQRHRPDLVADVGTLVKTGFVAMMLRWPETEAAGRRAYLGQDTVRQNRDEFAEIKVRSEQVLVASGAGGQELCAA